MPDGGILDEGADPLVDHFVRLVTEGRGDLARGRHLFTLRALDAMWDPDGVIELPYRPTRNPAAFLEMTFDVAGDVRFGYTLLLQASAESSHRVEARLRSHISRRLNEPWSALVAQLERMRLSNLAAVVSDTILEGLGRPLVSDLPAEIERIQAWMTEEQVARFDRSAFIAGLSFGKVLKLFRWGSRAGSSGREQHPAGGDLRAHLRRKLDVPWEAALVESGASDAHELLAGMPLDVAQLAAASGEVDFAVAYALATDAPVPGREWVAPEPFVAEGHRSEFEFLVGRGSDATGVRRTTRLQRWGASLVFPNSFRVVDERLGTVPGLDGMHAGRDWRGAVGSVSDRLAVLRRRFLERVAARMRPESGRADKDVAA
ncbi:MAG: hypothetical protein KF813_12095 [Trueperaceae bacterium]|nr:hypothetical protein [Trueperaceae bacterium]